MRLDVFKAEFIPPDSANDVPEEGNDEVKARLDVV